MLATDTSNALIQNASKDQVCFTNKPKADEISQQVEETLRRGLATFQR